VKKRQEQEVDCYFAKLRPDVLRVKGRRNPNKVPARVNSVHARVSMQRKADAAVIDKAKSINRNWLEVKIWGKSVTGRLAHEDRPHPFSVPEEEVGVNMANFRRMRKQDLFHVFSRIYSLPPEEGSRRAWSNLKAVRK
jgi:hypothetical protein